METSALKKSALYEQRNHGDYLRYKGINGELYLFDVITLTDDGEIEELKKESWLTKSEVKQLKEV